MTDIKHIAVWDFPLQEFDAWRTFTGNEEIRSFADYQDMLTGAITDFEQAGFEWVKVALTVDEMRNALDDLGLDNTPDSRAVVLNLASTGGEKF